MDHMDVWAYESAMCAESDWERWIAAVEKAAGIDADGSIEEDGWSLDSFCEMWSMGATVEEAVSASPEMHRIVLTV